MSDREISRLLIQAIVLGSLGGLLVAQSPKPLKTFVPPKLLEYVVEPVLAKDDGCARDYAQALAASGIEQRKQLTALITYECIEVIHGFYHVFTGESRSIIVAGKPTQILQVHLVAIPIGGVVGSKIDASGWILSPKAGERPEQGRSACSNLYQETYRKKQGDLTLSEEQQVRACQALSMYDPPR